MLDVTNFRNLTSHNFPHNKASEKIIFVKFYRLGSYILKRKLLHVQCKVGNIGGIFLFVIVHYVIQCCSYVWILMVSQLIMAKK